MGDINLLNLEALSKPIEKLLEVISTGFGVLHEPRRIRKEADARAYEIITLAKARSTVEEMEQERVERAQERMLQREMKRLKNTEQIIQYAAQQLMDEEHVSEAPVDEDWSTRFFNNAQDVSDSEMQKLWAKILAGEIKQPKSYSLRTLEFLKTVTKDEAELFSKIVQFILIDISNNSTFIFVPDNPPLLSDLGVTLDELLRLDEIGLIKSENIAITADIKHPKQYLLLNGNMELLFQHVDKNNDLRIRFYVMFVTRVGIELSRLIDAEANMDYIQAIEKQIKSSEVVVRIAKG